MWECIIGYMACYSQMQHASPRTSSWVSLQQTVTNETESKSQTLNTQSFLLKAVRLTYLSSADVALSLLLRTLILKLADNE